MWSSIKQEIRRTNVEIRNKLEVQNPKDKNHRLGFRASKFEFVSDFGFRVSSFGCGSAAL
ncbi:MAG: hypothetical protein A2Z34_06165 [Planctomycetes bacterium RBG_16_59_8]|nr:MAG: hypothetical protein A2Z34_06165 [Planctomycetes bacterium RBG_16_59_8]